MITLKTFDYTKYDNNGNYVGQCENDIGLDESGRNLAMLSNEEAVMRVVKHRVQTRKYELLFDMNKGIPYTETIFDNPFYLPLWSDNLKKTIEGTEEVVSVAYINPELDSANRKLKYTCGITTTYGYRILTNG